METLLNIAPHFQDNDDYSLLMELGPHCCNYVYFNNYTKTIEGAVFIAFEEWEMEEKLSDLLSNLQSNAFRKVVVSSFFPESVLVPQKYYQNNNLFLSSCYNRPDHIYMDDSVAEWQLINLYSFPRQLYTSIKNIFSNAEFLHTHTASLRFPYGVEDLVVVHFTVQNFSVVIKKDQQLQLAQLYSYKAPYDVIYYLVKICYEFQMDPANINVLISGFIPEGYSLLKDLSDYFGNIRFTENTVQNISGQSFPGYYFHSFHKLALCVS